MSAMLNLLSYQPEGTFLVLSPSMDRVSYVGLVLRKIPGNGWISVERAPYLYSEYTVSLVLEKNNHHWSLS